MSHDEWMVNSVARYLGKAMLTLILIICRQSTLEQQQTWVERTRFVIPELETRDCVSRSIPCMNITQVKTKSYFSQMLFFHYQLPLSPHPKSPHSRADLIFTPHPNLSAATPFLNHRPENIFITSTLCWRAVAECFYCHYLGHAITTVRDNCRRKNTADHMLPTMGM